MVEPTKEIGIFPLPDIVLFPEVHVPLHVFEPRYRALVKDALDGSRRIGMAVLSPGFEEEYFGAPDLYPHACVGEIVGHEAHPDGTSDIIVRGERIVTIEEFVQEIPFRVARVREYAKERSFAEAPGAEARREELERLIEAACPGCLEVLRERFPECRVPGEPLGLLHAIAMHLPVPVERKVDWLARPGSLARWESIRRTLAAIADSRIRRVRAMKRYADLAPEEPGRN